MFLPSRPSYLPLVQLTKESSKSLDKMAGIDSSISAGVGVFGSAAAYALVWELGSKRLAETGPGPKTMWSVNRKGEKAVLTTQAPAGYVGINSLIAEDLLAHAFNSVKFDLMDINKSMLRLEVALDNAVLKLARIISDDAPVDSGDLRSQIQSISTDEWEHYSSSDDDGVLIL